MRWYRAPYRWRRHFAFLPVSVGQTTVWFEWIWVRPGGDCTEVSFVDPESTAPLCAGCGRQLALALGATRASTTDGPSTPGMNNERPKP